MLYECIKECKVNNPFSVIADICQEQARLHKYHVSDLFTGHGIGHKLHMPPMIHHVPLSPNQPQIREYMTLGNVFTIEPIVLMRRPDKISFWKDNFTVQARNVLSGIYSFCLSFITTNIILSYILLSCILLYYLVFN